MDRNTAIVTVRTVWQHLASLGQEASREASKAKEVLNQLIDEKFLLNGRQIREMTEDVANLMNTIKEHDAAERMPQTSEANKSVDPPKKYHCH